MADRADLEKILAGRGYDDYRWMDPKDIVVSQWVRMKCMYGCGDYGRNASCPPNTPSIPECRDFFRDYTSAIVFHFARRFDDPAERHGWAAEVNSRLLEVEREVFLAGCHKVFLLFMDNCHLCGECADSRSTCRNKAQARPAPEAMGVDVFATVAKLRYPLTVVKGYEEEMNRYAFLMVE